MYDILNHQFFANFLASSYHRAQDKDIPTVPSHEGSDEEDHDDASSILSRSESSFLRASKSLPDIPQMVNEKGKGLPPVPPKSEGPLSTPPTAGVSKNPEGQADPFSEADPNRPLAPPKDASSRIRSSSETTTASCMRPFLPSSSDAVFHSLPVFLLLFSTRSE